MNLKKKYVSSIEQFWWNDNIVIQNENAYSLGIYATRLSLKFERLMLRYF